MNTWFKDRPARRAGRLLLSAGLMTALFALSPLAPDMTGYAAGMHAGGGQQGGDQVQDRLQLRDGSCQDTLLVQILAGDEDQDRDRQRLRDGSCGTGCGGEPDQDRVRDRIGQH